MYIFKYIYHVCEACIRWVLVHFCEALLFKTIRQKAHHVCFLYFIKAQRLLILWVLTNKSRPFTVPNDILLLPLWAKMMAYPLGMGRYTYLPIWYYHNTWVPIRYVLRFFFLRISILQVLRFDIAMLRFLFFVLTLDHGKKLNNTLNIQTVTIKKKHILAVTIAIRY